MSIFINTTLALSLYDENEHRYRSGTLQFKGRASLFYRGYCARWAAGNRDKTEHCHIPRDNTAWKHFDTYPCISIDSDPIMTVRNSWFGSLYLHSPYITSAKTSERFQWCDFSFLISFFLPKTDIVFICFNHLLLSLSAPELKRKRDGFCTSTWWSLENPSSIEPS